VWGSARAVILLLLAPAAYSADTAPGVAATSGPAPSRVAGYSFAKSLGGIDE